MSERKPALSVQAAHHRDTYVVRIQGALDLAGSAELERALDEAEQSNADRIFLDLEELMFIDVAGARVIHAASRRSARNGSRLQISRGDWRVARVFQLLGLEGSLPFLDAALVPDLIDLVDGRPAEAGHQRRPSDGVAVATTIA